MGADRGTNASPQKKKHIVVVIGGRRCAGKDYFTIRAVRLLKEMGIYAHYMRISDPMKAEFARERAGRFEMNSRDLCNKFINLLLRLYA